MRNFPAVEEASKFSHLERTIDASVILYAHVLASPPARIDVRAVAVGVNAGVILSICVWIIISTVSISSLIKSSKFPAVFAESGIFEGLGLGLVSAVRTASY